MIRTKRKINKQQNVKSINKEVPDPTVEAVPKNVEVQVTRVEKEKQVQVNNTGPGL